MLCPLFRRQWPSLYEALQDGRPERKAWLDLLLDRAPHHGLDRPLLVGDHTAWPRLSARTLSGRTHHAERPTRLADGLPITAGLAFSTLALLPEPGTRWILPLLHERIKPVEKASAGAARQLQDVVEALRRRGFGRALAL